MSDCNKDQEDYNATMFSRFFDKYPAAILVNQKLFGLFNLILANALLKVTENDIKHYDELMFSEFGLRGFGLPSKELKYVKEYLQNKYPVFISCVDHAFNENTSVEAYF
jgi:hypothetical protein